MSVNELRRTVSPPRKAASTTRKAKPPGSIAAGRKKGEAAKRKAGSEGVEVSGTVAKKKPSLNRGGPEGTGPKPKAQAKPKVSLKRAKPTEADASSVVEREQVLSMAKAASQGEAAGENKGQATGEGQGQSKGGGSLGVTGGTGEASIDTPPEGGEGEGAPEQSLASPDLG